jgi:hypothetical protein
MAQAGAQKIQQLQQRWITLRLITDTLKAAGIAIFIGCLLHYLLGFSMWWALAIFIVSSIIIVAINRSWQLSLQKICSSLNLHYPQLEESSELVLKPIPNLNLLEQLQLYKVEQALYTVPTQPPGFNARLQKTSLFLLLALAASFAIAKTHQHWNFNKLSLHNNTTPVDSKATPPEKVLPQIDGVALTIRPPTYTGKGQRTQDKFTILAEEGAIVNWKISTNVAVKNAWLIFNGSERVALTGNRSTEWQTSRLISKPGFYQVSIDGKLSDLYQIQVIKDAPPVLRLKLPKQYTHIDAGEAPRVTINTTVTDDYGVSNAHIFATVAKGSGESVKFKDTSFAFNTPVNGGKAYNLQRTIDLPKIGMEPGDELYFYIQAQDNHQQKTRTDVLIVSIQDTAQLLSMDGIVSAANIKPEFFRSERQIILDTEKLLKDKDSISATVFKNRCNDLGADQKMLRLRYGKFLGEEDESGQEAEGNEEVGKAENFGNAKVVMDAFTDKHDNSEDATFLEPAAKAQLKATLNEMWKAELRLRLYKPQEALPFEYKALRLLKDLQQKSRSFVAKTSYNPPPIKPEKRLTGDLTKITQPVNQQNVKVAADNFMTLKKAVTVLEQSKHQALTVVDKQTLQVAAQQLAARATAQPGTYLKAVSAIRRILAAPNNIGNNDRALVEKAIQASLPGSKLTPYPTATVPDMGLGQRYYKNLNR